MLFILVCLGIFIIVCWIASELIIRKNYKDNHDIEKCSINKQLKLLSDAIDGLDGFEFENFAQQVFILSGLKAKVTPKTNDGGKDIIIKDKDGIVYIECKHYAEKNKITVNLIHKLISACTVDNVTRAIFITTSSYTSSSIELAKKCKTINIELWYKDDMLNLCRNIDMLRLLEWLGYDRNEVLKYCMV